MKTRAENRCWKCGGKIDACTAVQDGQVPDEGSLSVCIHCGALAFLNADLTLRRPTPKEAFTLAADFEIQRIVAAVRQVRP